MRLQSSTNDYKCCGCLHVRTATILLGVIKVLAYVAVLLMITVLIFKPQLLAPTVEENNKFLDCLCKQHEADRLNHHFIGQKDDMTTTKKPVLKTKDQKIELLLHKHKDRLYWKFFVVNFYLFFSVLLLHGAVNKNPSNLMPYLCLQVFDFVITFIWIIGHLTAIHRSNELFSAWKCMPFAHHLRHISPTALALIVLSMSFLCLSIQAYLIGVVWSCYTYLVQLRRQGNLGTSPTWMDSIWLRINARRPRAGQTSIVATTDVEQIRHDEDAGYDLPKYEEILRNPANNYMPPPYVTPAVSSGTIKESEEKK